jgi:hypothetical protein
LNLMIYELAVASLTGDGCFETSCAAANVGATSVKSRMMLKRKEILRCLIGDLRLMTLLSTFSRLL